MTTHYSYSRASSALRNPEYRLHDIDKLHKKVYDIHKYMHTSEKIIKLHENAGDESTREFFMQHGHVALANAYDLSLGEPATRVADRSTRLHANDRLSGQTGDIRYAHLGADNPLKRIIALTIQSMEQLGKPLTDAVDGNLRAQVIDQRPGAVGMWHRDNGVAVTTLQGSSWLEIEGEDNNPDAVYELIPGRIVVLNPALRLLHRGIASEKSPRTGLAIERIK